jgi:hypothetical protein
MTNKSRARAAAAMSTPVQFDPKKLYTFLSSDVNVSCEDLKAKNDWMKKYSTGAGVGYLIGWILLVIGMIFASIYLPKTNSDAVMVALKGTSIGNLLSNRKTILGLGWAAVAVYFVVLLLLIVGIYFAPKASTDVIAGRGVQQRRPY